MKKLLIGLLALAQLTAFAGTLEMRKQKGQTQAKSIELTLDQESQEIVVNSNINDISSQRIPLKNIKRLKSQINLKEYTDSISDAKWEAGSFYGTVGEVIVSIAYPFGVGLDLMLLPNKAMYKILENSKYKKDMKKLNKTASDEEEKVVVNENRFNRIIDALKAAAQDAAEEAVVDNDRNISDEETFTLEDLKKVGFTEALLEL